MLSIWLSLKHLKKQAIFYQVPKRCVTVTPQFFQRRSPPRPPRQFHPRPARDPLFRHVPIRLAKTSCVAHPMS